MRYPYPAVLDEIPLDGHAVIEASAGTGKTYTIEHLVVDRLLRTPARLEQLLVVTFTDKATSELRKRIRDLIERILTEAEAARLRGEGEEEEESEEGCEEPHTWLIDDEARRKLERALFSFDRAAILTIHAFCRKVLVDLAFDSGQLFEQDLVDGRRAFEGAWRVALRERLSTQPDLRRGVEQWLRYSGDLSRLEGLLYDAHKAGYVELARPAQHELAQVMERLARRWDHAALVGAYESAAIIASALEGAREVLGRADDVMREPLPLSEKARQLLKLNLDALITPHRSSSKKKLSFPDALPEEARDCVYLLTQLRLISEMDEAVERQVVELLLPPVSASLTERKRSAGEVDYDDLLRCVWRALLSPQGPSLAQTLRERFRYALIDEFQDTDPLQWKIFKRVFVDAPASGHGLYIIGDPKQAIYTFRGADVHTYIHARFELTQAGAPRVLLSKNYRSSPRLVDAVNAILDQGGDAPIFTGAIRYDEPVECGRGDLRLLDARGEEVAPVTLWKHHPPASTQGKSVISVRQLKATFCQHLAEHVHGLLNEESEALYIEDGEKGEEGEEGEEGARVPARRRVNASDVLILVRDNKEAFEVARALRSFEVPFTLYKPEGLLQGAEAREVYTLLQAVVDPHDRGARLKAFTTPFFGVPWQEVYHYSSLPPGHHRLERLLEWHQLAAQGRYGTLFYHLLHHSGLSERELFFAESERELTNYQHIFEILLGVTSQHKCTPRELCTLLGRYLEGLEAPPGSEDNIHRLYSDRQMVQVMTIHKSKGLEAPVIYLYGGFKRPPEQVVNLVHDDELGRRVIVGATARKAVAQRLQLEQRQEDQRLLYVALTRAQVKLFVPFVHTSRQLNGTYEPLKQRLRAMFGGEREGDEGLERWPGLFSVEEVSGERARLYAAPSDKTFTEWTPPAELLQVPDLSGERERLLRAQRPLVVTSYTRMKQMNGLSSLGSIAPRGGEGLEGERAEQGAEGAAVGWGGGFEPDLDREEGGDANTDALMEPLPRARLLEEGEGAEGAAGAEELAAEALPGGRHMGRCLHEVIEEVPFKTLARAKSPEEWAARPEVREVCEGVMRRHGVEARWLEAVATLVFGVLTTPLALPSGVLLPPLHAPRHLIEMEFMFPIPEEEHPALGAPAPPRRREPLPPRWRVERGFVKGFIDYLFEHEGRVYFADWKSDLCAQYEGEGLSRHVEEHYLLQAQLYTLGVVRWLKVRDEDDYERRFGGLLYLFLRAFTPLRAREGAAGVYFARPSWAEVQGYERLLGAALPSLGA